MMRARLLSVAVLTIMGLSHPTTARAQAVPDRATVRGELRFEGDGTLGAFVGRTTQLRGVLTGAPMLEGVRGWVESDAKSLVTGNGRRDKDMWKSLEVDRFPTLRFDLDAVAPGPPSPDSLAVTLRGRFTIHGVTRESAVRGWVHLESNRVRFHGYAPMVLTDYGIGGLSKAFGLLKMNPDVLVRMELTFEG
ncbi:MAG: YceI family protein [Gemmatimonadales bacterium]|nr:YceI family protein [Gemmatimonadales bacterium]